MVFSTHYRRLGQIAAGLSLAVLLGTAVMAGPARADDREWRAHEVHARHWHAHPVGVAPVVYAPPVFMAAPPPPPPPSGINLIIPLNIR